MLHWSHYMSTANHHIVTKEAGNKRVHWNRHDASTYSSYNFMKQVQHYWNWCIMAFMYQDIVRMFHKWIFHVFRNGQMDCRDVFIMRLCTKEMPGSHEVFESYWINTLNTLRIETKDTSILLSFSPIFLFILLITYFAPYSTFCSL